MKYTKYLIAILSLAFLSPAFADVHVSINVGAPDFFGRVDIAGAPPPALLLPRPVFIAPPGVNVTVEPMYLRVRPEESRNWRHYCSRYNACGHPVYFVKDTWYRNVYVPHYRAHHEEFEQRERDRMEHERMEQQRMQSEHHEHEQMQQHHDDHHDDHGHHDDHHDHDHHDHDDHH